MKKPISICLVFTLLLCLVACGNEESMNELKVYVQKIKARPARPIEPLPEVKPYQGFTYSAQDLRSPFVPPEPEEEIDKVVADNGIHPDVERRKELLENYPIDTLKMVGTLEREGRKWAIIVDKDGNAHRITVGNHLGQNHGRVEKIDDEKIELKEIVTDGRGGWQERQASMALIIE